MWSIRHSRIDQQVLQTGTEIMVQSLTANDSFKF